MLKGSTRLIPSLPFRWNIFSIFNLLIFRRWTNDTLLFQHETNGFIFKINLHILNSTIQFQFKLIDLVHSNELKWLFFTYIYMANRLVRAIWFVKSDLSLHAETSIFRCQINITQFVWCVCGFGVIFFVPHHFETWLQERQAFILFFIAYFVPQWILTNFCSVLRFFSPKMRYSH